MPQTRRSALITAALTTLLAVAVLASPAAANGVPVEGDTEPEIDQEVIEQKLENAWVPEQDELYFGAEPLQFVQDAASDAAAEANCTLDEDAATALVIAVTWPEVSAGGEAPSPMT